MQRFFVNIFPGRTNMSGPDYNSYNNDDETWSWIDNETNDTRIEDCISLASFPIGQGVIEDHDLDCHSTHTPQTYATIANSAQPLYDIRFPSTLKPTGTVTAKRPGRTNPSANVETLSASFADLRSASQAHRRQQAHNEKYWNHRCVKAGQLGREHYIITPRTQYGWVTQELRDEAQVTVMTKRTLFKEAQAWPRPPKYHRRPRYKNLGTDRDGVEHRRMKEKKHAGVDALGNRTFDLTADEVDTDVENLWASEAQLLCQRDEAGGEHGIGVWRVEPTRAVKRRQKRTKGRAAPRVVSAEDWGGWE